MQSLSVINLACLSAENSPIVRTSCGKVIQRAHNTLNSIQS